MADMTDHLDEAAAKAVDLAEKLVGVWWERDELHDLAARVAAHLTYMAGLLRGRVREPDYVTLGNGDRLVADKTMSDADARVLVSRNLQLIAVQERDEARAQVDELLAAAKQLLDNETGDAWPRVELRRVIERIEARP